MNKKVNQSCFVLLGGMADFDRADGDCLLKTRKGETVIWTAHKSMLPGDRAFFYITAPVSAIVAAGECLEQPWTNEDPGSRWSNYLMAEIGNIEHLPEKRRLKIKSLRELFPEWRWLAYPRANCLIPEDIKFPFVELFNSRFTLF